MKIFLILFLFFQSLAYANNVTTVSNKQDIFKTCNTESVSTLWKKLTHFSKFKTIDDSTNHSAFLKANLVTSDILWFENTKDETGQIVGKKAAIQFVIRPLSSKLSPVPFEHYPKFIAYCKARKNPVMTLTCSHHTRNVDPKNRFAVSDFNLNITLSPPPIHSACSGLIQESTYSISINNDEYDQIKSDIFKYEALQNFFSDLTDVNKFFEDYWLAFFDAWKKGDWVN